MLEKEAWDQDKELGIARCRRSLRHEHGLSDDTRSELECERTPTLKGREVERKRMPEAGHGGAHL